MTPSRIARLLPALVALFAATSSPTFAAGYPEKSIQYLIPFVAGGESDVVARLQQQVFSQKFKQEMVVVNRAGGGGALVWQQLNSLPGDGYTITIGGETTRGLKVVDEAKSKPSQGHYANQKLKAGNGYITTRDGTQLAVFITLPGPEEDGPYPTVVNYSGYDPAKPGAPVSDQAKILCGAYPILCEAPADASALIAAPPTPGARYPRSPSARTGAARDARVHARRERRAVVLVVMARRQPKPPQRGARRADDGHDGRAARGGRCGNEHHARASGGASPGGRRVG